MISYYRAGRRPGRKYDFKLADVVDMFGHCVYFPQAFYFFIATINVKCSLSTMGKFPQTSSFNPDWNSIKNAPGEAWGDLLLFPD